MKSHQLNYSISHKPITIEELNTRIDASMEDSKNGRLVSQAELLDRIKSWTSKSTKTKNPRQKL